MPKHLTSALMAGLLASGLFLLVFGAGLGFVFMFLPSLPLFFISLGKHARLGHIAVTIATLIIALIAGGASALLFLLFLGWPSWYFSKKSLLVSPHAAEGGQQWYPVGLIMMNLSLYACTLIAFMTWYYADQPGGLPQLLSQNIHEAFSDLEGDYGDIIERMASEWAFLMFPVTIWLWGILLFAHAWLANRILIRQEKQQRPDMVVHIFTIPSWMLSLLAICALASLIGSPSMEFLGKTALLSLMLPYFFLGCALMHRYSKTWPSSRFFLFFIYFMVLTQFWPVLIIAGFGLWHQIKCLSAGGTWFRN